MKPHGYILIVLFSGFATVLSAQPISHNQPQATLQRLYSTRTDNYDGSKFVPADSAHYTYSGMRGGGGHVYERESMPFDFARYIKSNGTLWSDSLRTTKTFDAHDSLLSSLSETFDGTNWNKSAKEELHYNAQGLLDTDAYYTWAAGAWSGLDKFTYTFDSRGNEITRLYQYLTDDKGNWINSEIDNFQFDTLNRNIEWDYATWNYGGWQNYIQNIQTFDQFGNTKTQTTLYWTGGSRWVNSSRISFQYASKTKLLSYLAEGWDQNQGLFYNKFQRIYSFDANDNTTRILVQYWINSQWQDSIIGNYNYYQNDSGYSDISLLVNAAQKTLDTAQRFITFRDKAGNDILDSTDIYKGPGDWQHSWVHRWSFDANNNTTLDDYENWDINTGTWLSGTKFTASYNDFAQFKTYENYQLTPSGWVPITLEHFWYEDYTGPASVRPEPKTISSEVYPNPFTKSFTIEFHSEKNENITLLLYDVKGNLITRTTSNASAGENKITWDPGFPLPKGWYTYELIAGNEVSTGKLLAK